MWKELAHAFFFIYSFLSFQSCPCLLVLFPMHTPTHSRSVKCQREDGCNLNLWILERVAMVSRQSSQAALPRPVDVDCLACSLGLCSWDTLLLSVWTNALSPQVSAAHMVGEWNGNRPTELPKGPRGSWQKAKLWRARWVNLQLKEKNQELERSTFN